ncbi:hypothetical protein NicSoilC5_39200 [Arthrobacter sp. NicSoilC5]|nr:hypothetical protein NicSoilC5_39200 [Arthrobacter sp. NicSoilC5]
MGVAVASWVPAAVAGPALTPTSPAVTAEAARTAAPVAAATLFLVNLGAVKGMGYPIVPAQGRTCRRTGQVQGGFCCYLAGVTSAS